MALVPVRDGGFQSLYQADARRRRDDSRGRSRSPAPAARPKSAAKSPVGRSGGGSGKASAAQDPAAVASPALRLLQDIDSLPGEVTLSEADLASVVNRLVALGFSSLGAFTGLAPDSAVNIYYTETEVGEGNEDVVNKAGVVVLIHRLCAEATRRSYEQFAGAGDYRDSPDKSKPSITTESLLWKIAKKYRRGKKNVDKDSSVESDDDVEPFNLADFLASYVGRPQEARLLMPGWFADLSRLARLKKDFANRQDHTVPFVYSSTFDEWVPSWVGEAKSKSERKRLRTQMQSEPARTLANLLSLVSSYWLSHMSAGAVSMSAVLAHLLQVVRIAQERSVTFAYAYVSKLQARIRSDIKAGVRFSLDELIAGKDPVTFGLVELEIIREGGRTGPATPQTGRTGPPAQQKTSPPTKAPPRPPAPPTTPAVRGSAAARPKPVCFQYDPRNGRRCTVRACRFEHLDTTTPDGARAFARAKQAAGR